MPNPKRRADRRPLRLLVIGDSTAEGVGAESGSVAELVAACLSTDFVVTTSNLARRGARTGDVVRQQLPKAARFKPSLVLIGLGANEVIRPRLWTKYAERRLYRETAELIRGLREHQPDLPIVHTGSPPMDTIPRIPKPLRRAVYRRVQYVNDVIRKTCREENAVYVELANETREAFARGSRELFSADRFHVNDAGYRLSAEPICRAVKARIRSARS